MSKYLSWDHVQGIHISLIISWRSDMWIPINTTVIIQRIDLVKTAGNISTRHFYTAWVYWSLKLDYSTKNVCTRARDYKGYTYHWLFHELVICVSIWTQLLYWLSTQEEKCPLHLHCQNWLARNIYTRHLFIAWDFWSFTDLGCIRLHTGDTHITNYYMAQWYVYPLKTAVI